MAYLEIWVRSHSRSLKMSPFDGSCMVHSWQLRLFSKSAVFSWSRGWCPCALRWYGRKTSMSP